MRGTAACAGYVGRDGDEYGAFSSLIFSFMMSIFHVFGKRRAYACVCVLLQSSSEAVQRGCFVDRYEASVSG